MMSLYAVTFLVAPFPPMTTYWSPRSIPQLSLNIIILFIIIKNIQYNIIDNIIYTYSAGHFRSKLAAEAEPLSTTNSVVWRKVLNYQLLKLSVTKQKRKDILSKKYFLFA